MQDEAALRAAHANGTAFVRAGGVQLMVDLVAGMLLDNATLDHTSHKCFIPWDGCLC